MDKFTLLELYQLRNRMLSSNDYSLISEINESIETKENEILENTSATGGISVGGSGAVVSAQPSGLAGQTIGTNWASNGGTTGSGDVSVPYNPSGSNRMSQTLKSPVMGKNHGSRTGKKSRTKKLDLKTIKDLMAKSKEFKPSKKVMNFNDFQKNDFTTIKK